MNHLDVTILKLIKFPLSKKNSIVLYFLRIGVKFVSAGKISLRELQELAKETELEDGHLTRIVVESLQQTKKLIEESPHVMLDRRTKELRQACFKESFKRRGLIAGHVTW